MVLCQTISGRNPAEEFASNYNSRYGDNQCRAYHSTSDENILTEFKRGIIRVLVVVGRLLEGFDHKPVSVVVIHRNVGFNSRVLFTQFVGRAVRKLYKDDPVTTIIISHLRFNQQVNFNQMEQHAEVEQESSDDEQEE